MSNKNFIYTLSFILLTAILTVLANKINQWFLFFAGFFIMATIVMFLLAERTNE